VTNCIFSILSIYLINKLLLLLKCWFATFWGQITVFFIISSFFSSLFENVLFIIPNIHTGLFIISLQKLNNRIRFDSCMRKLLVWNLSTVQHVHVGWCKILLQFICVRNIVSEKIVDFLWLSWMWGSWHYIREKSWLSLHWSAVCIKVLSCTSFCILRAGYHYFCKNLKK